MMPLVIEPPDRTPRKDMPSSTRAAISGCPNAMIMGSTAGTIASAKKTGRTPPNIELVTAAPIARAALPL